MQCLQYTVQTSPSLFSEPLPSDDVFLLALGILAPFPVPLNHTRAVLQWILYVPAVLMLSSCLNTTLFASRKRSTQFCMHGSSLRSSLPEEILLVMHLRKQMSVKVWIAVWPREEEEEVSTRFEPLPVAIVRGQLQGRERIGGGNRGT